MYINISLHISNQSEILLMFILKLFLDIFVSFLKREVIITFLWNENIAILDLYMMKKKKKKTGKSGWVKSASCFENFCEVNNE